MTRISVLGSFQVRRPRGNIILTALFISVFLFFLSIALIWTNRQDIALSLAMEHKMKGEAAARSGAMRVYASLRNLGLPPSAMEGTLDNGATWKCQLVELPPEGDRGPLVLLHCRGTSGPLSIYYTMHLLKSDLGQELSDGTTRMLTFLQGGGGSGTTPPAEEGGESAAETTTTAGATGAISSQAKVLYPDFVLKSIDLKLEEQAERAAAYQGPLFISSKATTNGSPLQVIAFVPVFSLATGALKAFGPVALNVPAPENEYVLSVMTLEGDQFAWKQIPFPVPEPDDLDPPPIAALDIVAPPKGKWNTLAVRTINETGSTPRWRDLQPGTSSESEALDLEPGSQFEIELNKAVEWGTAKAAKTKRGYTLIGAIAANGENVYSYAWEYLYKHYNGMTAAPPIPAVYGSTITRWPCVRKYNIGSKKWSTAWSGLKDNGDVFSSEVPGFDALVVNKDGVCWGLDDQSPKRLLRMDPSGPVEVGPEVPSGKIFLYHDQPHTISDDPKKPGIKNLIDNAVIGFDTLPPRIPEISGPVVTQMANEDPSNIGLAPIEVTPVTEQSSETPEICTVRPQYDITYQVDPNSSMAADGDNLYANLIVTVTKKEPTYEMFGKFELSGSGGTVLARYDGQRWHILPNGLMPLLTGDGSLSTPGKDMYCAYYSGTDKAKSRYTVVSIDTDPFEFSK